MLEVGRSLSCCHVGSVVESRILRWTAPSTLFQDTRVDLTSHRNSSYGCSYCPECVPVRFFHWRVRVVVWNLCTTADWPCAASGSLPHSSWFRQFQFGLHRSSVESRGEGRGRAPRCLSVLAAPDCCKVSFRCRRGVSFFHCTICSTFVELLGPILLASGVHLQAWLFSAVSPDAFHGAQAPGLRKISQPDGVPGLSPSSPIPPYAAPFLSPSAGRPHFLPACFQGCPEHVPCVCGPFSVASPGCSVRWSPARSMLLLPVDAPPSVGTSHSRGSVTGGLEFVKCVSVPVAFRPASILRSHARSRCSVGGSWSRDLQGGMSFPAVAGCRPCRLEPGTAVAVLHHSLAGIVVLSSPVRAPLARAAPEKTERDDGANIGSTLSSRGVRPKR